MNQENKKMAAQQTTGAVLTSSGLPPASESVFLRARNGAGKLCLPPNSTVLSYQKELARRVARSLQVSVWNDLFFLKFIATYQN